MEIDNPEGDGPHNDFERMVNTKMEKYKLLRKNQKKWRKQRQSEEKKRKLEEERAKDMQKQREDIKKKVRAEVTEELRRKEETCLGLSEAKEQDHEVSESRPKEATIKKVSNVKEINTSNIVKIGTFGQCHLGMYRGILVAIKEFHSKGDKESLRKDVKHEATVMSELGNHPGLPLLFVVDLQNHPYKIVLQFQGEKDRSLTINKAAKQKKLTNDEWLDVVDGVGKALEHVHSRGLLHNDLKSNNIVLEKKRGVLQPSYNRLWKEHQDRPPSKRKLMNVEEQKVYSRNYPHIAPEVVNGSGPKSVASDTYSFAVMIEFLCQTVGLNLLCFNRSWYKSPKQSRLTRSSMVTTHPKKCAICQDDKPDPKDRRRKENLTICETMEAGRTLLEAPKIRGHQNLVVALNDKDPIAIDLCYHRTCYRTYTNAKQSEAFKLESQYDAAFQVLSSELEPKLFIDLEVLGMSDLRQRYVGLLGQQGIENPLYRSEKLKVRMQKAFSGRISFWRTRNRSEAEIVYCDEIPKGQIISTWIDRHCCCSR